MTPKGKLCEIFAQQWRKSIWVASFGSLADALIANGVEIPVRCGKCEHWVEDDDGRGQEGICYCHGRKRSVRKRADGYCDRGVMK